MSAPCDSGWTHSPTTKELANEIDALETEGENETTTRCLTIASTDLRELSEREGLVSAYELLGEAIDSADTRLVREKTRGILQCILGLLGGVEP